MERDKISFYNLFVEEDIVLRIIFQVDFQTIQNLERSSVTLWNFIKSLNVWRRKFHQEYPDFFINSQNKEILTREQFNWDDHFKFKRLSLKISSLHQNWERKKYLKKNFDLSTKLENEKFRYFDQNVILTETCDNFFPTVSSVYDLNKFSLVHKFDEISKFRISSANSRDGYLAVFGEPKLSSEASSHHDSNYMIKVFSLTKFQLVKQSVLLHENDVTPWSCVKIFEKTVLLFVSHKEGKDLNLQNDTEAVQVFKIVDDAKHLVHEKKIQLELPAKRYLSKWDFDTDYFLGCRKRDTFAEVWSIKDFFSTEETTKAPLIWSSDVSYRGLFKCSCVLINYPDVFIGLSNGRCDIYDIQFNVKRRSLRHQSPSVLDYYPVDYISVRKVLTTNLHIITLSSDYKLYVWSKEDVLGLGRPEVSFSDPLWTVNSTRGQRITDMFADSTKIVTLTSGSDRSDVIIYDFWHCKKKTGSLAPCNPPIVNKNDSGRPIKKCKFC